MTSLLGTYFDVGELLEFASLGSYCEYDLFGMETSHYQFGEIDMPSDAQRIQLIKKLVEEGFEDKIVIAHDIHHKHRLVRTCRPQTRDVPLSLTLSLFQMKYGGHGYSHILLNVVPKMRARGISDDVIDKILTRNPRQWLQF